MGIAPIKNKHNVEGASAIIIIAQLLSLIKYNLVKMLSDRNFIIMIIINVALSK